MTDTAAQIEQLLRAAFSPDTLVVEDESARHAGHAGARDGGGHYRVTIVAGAFADKSRIERHRMVNAAVADLIPSRIHALAIKASAPQDL